MLSAAVRTLAATAVAGLATTAPAAAPASAYDDHHGDHDGDRDVSITLSQRTADELRDGNNDIAARGAADKDVRRGRVTLSFPVRGDDRRDRTGHHDGGDLVGLAGTVAFTGAGPDVTWSRLRINTERGTISAVVGGDRQALLRFAGWSHHRTARGIGGDHGRLVLTRAGAASLNKAAQGSPFEAGDAFSGGGGCRL